MKTLKTEQNNVNKRSGRKCSDYSKLESDYQEAQSHWEQFGDKPSWDKMFIMINLFCFNNINKKLEKILDREEIEQRALDVTMNILTSLLKKKSLGQEWKIAKVSSACYLPCLAIYAKKLQFEDQILDESSYTLIDEKGNESILEYEDSYMSGGIYHLHR